MVFLKIQDKDVKIRQEKSEKERLKSDFRTRLDMNNQHWERNLVCTDTAPTQIHVHHYYTA